MPTVELAYHTGIARSLFRNVRLCGSWDSAGVRTDTWSTMPMRELRGEDGCPEFRATVELADDEVGREFSWGVLLDGPLGRNIWGIPTEVRDASSGARHRSFLLQEDTAPQEYWLSTSRRMGANLRWGDVSTPDLEFAVWAPNALDVSVVFGDPESGYIDEKGVGVVGDPVPMQRQLDGIWTSDRVDLVSTDHRPYMYRVVKDDSTVAFRTDLYSRCQIGRGRIDPARLEPGEVFSGRREDLDGTVGCSVVIDPGRVTELFSEPVWPETRWLDEREFWADELDPDRPLPARVEDLVIYELHVGGLGAGRVDADGEPVPGTLGDAIELLDHLVALGINAVELLPMAEFEGWASWGYGTSHYFAVEFSGGGRDQLKHFVRECHRRGIAVILDVVYNHYHHFAERAEWAYDSDDPSRNIYYWYEGRPEDYPDPTGGYIDNLSTGWAPRLWEELVRQMLISSAVAQAVEFHIDGFRVDQTTSLHAYAALHADGRRADVANAFGLKFLRELTRTLRLVKPHVFLLAEDHSGWSGVTTPADLGGLGFDATWYADFYHHLSGDTGRGPEYANLLTTAARADDGPLAMDLFAETLRHSADSAVVYHESHDEAGNSSYDGGRLRSGRTLSIAVNRASLVGDTRRYGEARARFAAGMSLLSAATPMFFMGEEVGATEDYRYDDFAAHRTDILAEAQGDGRDLVAFYRDLIDLRGTFGALRSRSIDIVHVNNEARMLAFRRWAAPDELLVLASLNDQPFRSGYSVPLGAGGDGVWREVFNSDSAMYGGWNDGNLGADLSAAEGLFIAVIPRCGFVVFCRVG